MKKNTVIFRNLTVKFGEKIILNKLNFSFNSSSSVCVIGEGSSGKTTILKSLLGLVPIDKGEIKINGFKVDQPPSGAFYIFPEISELFGKTFKGQLINNANDLSMLILEKAHVATVPGDAFGYPECIRISYSASREQIKDAIIRIKDLLS